MRRPRIRYTLYLAAMVLLLEPASLAARKKPNVPFDLIATTAPFDAGATFTAPRGAVLTSIDISVPIAVELDGEIDSAIQEMIASEAGAAIGAGSILVNSNPSENIYCGPIMSRGMGKAGPCLIDTDGDGKFDRAVKGGADANQPTALGIATNGKLMGISYAKHSIALPALVRYHRVPYAQGPKGKADLVWTSNFNPKRPGPVRIAFWMSSYNDWAGTSLASAPVEVTFAGHPVAVDINGLRLTVLGVGDKGELNFRLSGTMSSVPVRFEFLDRQNAAIFYI